MILFWLIAGIVMIILELVISGGFMLLIFGLAAITISAVAYLTQMGWMFQVGLFLIASLMYTMLLKDNLKKLLFRIERGDDPENEFVGKKGKALTAITKDHGTVEFKGTQWPAKSEWPVLPGDEVEIVSQESILLNVKPLKQ